jgi:hypothetical protein
MILHGRNLIIKAAGTAIAAARSCTIDIECDEQEVSNPLNGQWKMFIPVTNGWKVSVSGLVMAESGHIPDHLRTLKGWVGTTLTLQVCARLSTEMPAEPVFTGQALCKNARVAGTVGNLTSYTMQFLGTGELTNGE